MARPKTRLVLAQRRLLAELATVAAAFDEAREERERLVVAARDAGIPAERVADAARLSAKGVDKIVERRRQASGS